MDMKSLLNMHALNSLLCAPERPAQSLGIADDERLDSVPLLIFTDQHLPMPEPEILPNSQLSYEKIQLKGTNNSLDLSDFETQAFSVGGSYGGV